MSDDPPITTPWHTGEIMDDGSHVYTWIDGELTNIDGRTPTEQEKARVATIVRLRGLLDEADDARKDEWAQRYARDVTLLLLMLGVER